MEENLKEVLIEKSEFLSVSQLAKILKISEWPQKASGFIPDPDLVIDFEFTENEDSRIIKLKALTQIGHKLLEK